jgi:hypothetical protein
MRFVRLALILGTILCQDNSDSLRCDCAEFSYYWNPLWVFRDTLSFFRLNWPPQRVDISSIWNAPKYPDYFKVDAVFSGKAHDHMIRIDLFNLHGASTFNEDFYHQPIFVDNGSKLSLEEKNFPWFKKESGFRCEEIENGTSVNHRNDNPLVFDDQSSVPFCLRKKPIAGKIEVKIQSEESSCSSEFWFENELAMLKSLDIFDFCQTPRILSLQTNSRGPIEDVRYLDSSVRIAYECRNGQKYTALVEHFVLNASNPSDPCANKRTDPSNIFSLFKGGAINSYCLNARTYLDQTLNKSGYKSSQTKSCSCNVDANSN